MNLLILSHLLPTWINWNWKWYRNIINSYVNKFSFELRSLKRLNKSEKKNINKFTRDCFFLHISLFKIQKICTKNFLNIKDTSSSSESTIVTHDHSRALPKNEDRVFGCSSESFSSWMVPLLWQHRGGRKRDDGAKQERLSSFFHYYFPV